MPMPFDKANSQELADLVNRMPFMRTVTLGESEALMSSSIAHRFGPGISIEFTRGCINAKEFVALTNDELFSTIVGEHVTFGGFVHAWSVRGPGDGARPRPMFLFYDNAAVLLSAEPNDAGEAFLDEDEEHLMSPPSLYGVKANGGHN